MSHTPGFMEQLLETFEVEGKLRNLAKGDCLIREGEVERHLYLVKEGALQAIYRSGEEEHIIRFGYTGSIINALPSFLHSAPSEYILEAIRKTTVSCITRDTLYALVHRSEEHQRQYMALLENLVVQQMERELDLLTPSPQDRLERVLRRSPQLFQEIPLKYIANYLRMSPETLSRIRNS